MEKDLLEEIWKPIKNYERLYEISNYGRVKSINRLVNGRWGFIKIKEKILKPVLQFDLNNKFIKRYESMTEAEKQLKIKHIYDCCNGKLRKAGGFIWRYEDGR